MAAAGLLLITGCAKEPGPADDGAITVEASIGRMTRVSYSGNGTSFTAGDRIAVYGWTGGADAVSDTRVVDGVLNTLGSDGKWTPESPMLWNPGGEAHYFLGIYPAPTSVSNFTEADYMLDPSKYTDSDLLVATNLKGVTASQGAVALVFDHLMARLDVNLKFRGEFGGTPTVTSVSALARSAATVNCLTKEVTAKGDASAIAVPAAASAATGYALSFSGLQVPQEGVRKITVSIGGKEYVYESATDIPLTGGKYTTIGLVVGKDKIELGGVTVSDWEAVDDLPGGEAKPFTPYLTFTSEGTTKISLKNIGDNAPVLYYSFDKTNWTQWDYSELTFTSSAPLYICGDNPGGFSASSYKYSQFVDNGSNYSVSGDIMSLLNKDVPIEVIPNKYCFSHLFYGCGLTAGPELKATTLAKYCYSKMFRGCTGLTTAPELPATTLAENCYSNMFSGCTGLTSAPELPATTLADYCYLDMFSGCTGLTTAPELKATKLARYCYGALFYGCTGLTTAPELPATTLAEFCYIEMFHGCTGLTTAPELKATSLAEHCYYSMFSGCTGLNYVKCLATDISAYNCLNDWLKNVASSGTFVKAEGMNDWPSGPSGIPEGWTVEDNM